MSFIFNILGMLIPVSPIILYVLVSRDAGFLANALLYLSMLITISAFIASLLQLKSYGKYGEYGDIRANSERASIAFGMLLGAVISSIFLSRWLFKLW